MRPDKPIELTLPITPMLDTSFQLLSFFVLTFRVLPAEGQLEIRFPNSTAKDELVRIKDDDFDLPAQYTIRVHASAKGDITSVSLNGPTRPNQDVQPKDLLKELKSLPKPAGKDAKAISLTIETAAQLNYARLIEIMDICKKAGYTNVALSPLRDKT